MDLRFVTAAASRSVGDTLCESREKSRTAFESGCVGEAARFPALLPTGQGFFAVILPALLRLYSESRGDSETRAGGSLMCINILLA